MSVVGAADPNSRHDKLNAFASIQMSREPLEADPEPW